MSTRTVYVVEADVYEQRYVAGIYDTAERAMGAYPDERWTATTYGDGDPHIDNGKDWGEALHIQEATFADDGPERPVDESIVYVEVNGRYERQL